MAHLSIQCQNCGAKYKIPETFTAPSAKCKACGSRIEVAAARSSDSDTPSPAAAAESAASEGGTRRARAAASEGGTRRPRQTQGAGRRREEPESGERASGRRAAAGAAGSRRRGRGGEDEEGGGRAGRQQKKGSSQPLVIGGAILGIAVLGVVGWMVMRSDGKADPQKSGTSKVASKDADKNKGDTPAKADPKTDGDAAKSDAAKADGKSAAEASASKTEEPKKADTPKPKKTKKKKAKKAKTSKPTSKRAEHIKKDEDIKSMADVFKPSSVLKPLERPQGLTDEQVKEIEGLMDAMRSSGLPAIRAADKLGKSGVKMVPLAVNRLLTLDYTKPEDNSYCYTLANQIRLVTDFTFGWEPVQPGTPLDPKVANRNAGRVWDVHQMARLYWHSDEGMQKYRAAYKKGDKGN